MVTVPATNSLIQDCTYMYSCTVCTWRISLQLQTLLVLYKTIMTQTINKTLFHDKLYMTTWLLIVPCAMVSLVKVFHEGRNPSTPTCMHFVHFYSLSAVKFIYRNNTSIITMQTGLTKNFWKVIKKRPNL